MGTPVVSEEVRAYFAGLLKQVQDTYAIARAARTRGFDPELDVEIPLTDDLASRVERLLENYEVEGVARRIRELAKTHDREELAILVAKEMAVRPATSKEKAVERAVRVGLAILTEGILVAPLEGLAGVKIKRNRDGSSYVDLSYAGPIRSAGGTGQALSVLIADIVRRELGLGRYVPTREEVERFKEEIPLYRQAQHLQYTPSDEEISLIVSNCPVAIDGEGTEDAEISGHRDLPRVETNRIRGGACLVIADGMCLKAPKIQKHVKKLHIDGWEFIDEYLARKESRPEDMKDELGVEPSEVFIQNIVAGRPVLCHPSRPGGLRLRYGRTRATGLAALALHPATMHILDDFIAVGTQIKTERPGKAGAVTPCDRIEGPLVVLDSGDFVEVTDAEAAKRLTPRVRDRIGANGRIDDGRLVVPGDEEPREWLVRLGATYRVRGDEVVVERHTAALLATLGIEVGPVLRLAPAPASDDPLAFVSALAGLPVKARGPTRIGARMARPEKSAPRKMQPAPHSLFPIGHEGGAQRLLLEAASKETIEVEVGLRICESCGKRWFLPKCSCGGHTVSRNGPTRQRIPLADVLRTALERMGETKPAEIKAVQGMISRTKTPEPIEKGVLRAKHDVYVFKDGTTRFDMTNLPLTHFTPEEVGISVETARRLGYARDRSGRPLEREDQTVELRPQDIVVARSCGEYLVRVAGFIDDLLERLYGLGRFYEAKSPEDLLGHLVVTLAPHTSGGVLARIVGFTDANACFAHPYLIAARRRNCDGDEDSVILLLDCLVNFSRAFLPDKRGGLMDAPLVLTTRIDPNEIDKEAHNLDVIPVYPTSLYEAAERFAHPKEIEPQIDTVSKRIGSVLQYEGFVYTHETSDIAQGPLASAYGEGSMAEKIDKQLEISKRISQQFEVSNYLRQRIDLIEDAITSLFTNDKTQDLKLDDFF